jgi:transposase
MRGTKEVQTAMFSYMTLERRVPEDHPLRSIRTLMDQAMDRLEPMFERMYSSTGRPSIAPEKLLRALLVQVLYSVSSERRLMEQLDYNLLFRWFVGLEMDDAVWDVTVFTKNRQRLIDAEISQQLLSAVLMEASQRKLLSEEHFTVDGTLIPAWALSRSFHAKDDPPAPGKGSGSGGKLLLRDTTQSSTDPEARLYKKATADKAVPSYLGHVMMENRNGLAVACAASLAATDAERTEALALLDRTLGKVETRPEMAAQWTTTLGADTQYQTSDFVQGLRDRRVAPHVSQYQKGNLGKNQLTVAERQDPRLPVSQNKRKLVERIFGWSKLDRMLGRVKQRGLQKVDWLFRFVITAYNLTRMRRLIQLAEPNA